MRENLRFFFNNALSSDMWLTNVHLEDSLYEEKLIAERKINEQKIIGNTKPYIMSIDHEPIQFELAFAFTQNFDDEKLREVANWLDVNYYKEFYFLDNPKYRFFAMPTGNIDFFHNGLKQGYLKLTMKTNDRYAFSQEYLSDVYDLSENEEGATITINNDGDTKLYTEMWITKVENGDIEIVNMSNDGKIFELRNLIDGEEIYIDNEREEIHSDIPNRYLFDNITTNYLQLVQGDNELRVTGSCKLQFRYRFKYIKYV